MDLPNQSNDLFAPWDASPEAVPNNPLLTVQHTRFACGGASIGLRINHVISDAWGIFLLSRNLAELYRGLAHEESPVLSTPPQIQSFLSENTMDEDETKNALAFRPSLYSLIPAEAQAVPHFQTVPETTSLPDTSLTSPVPPPPTLGRVLRFSSSRLSELKAEATNPESTWVSTFEALSAFLHQRIYKARLQRQSSTSGTLSPPNFLTPIDLRFGNRLQRLDPPYFPPSLLTPFNSISPEILANGHLWEVATHIHNLTRCVDAQEAEKTIRWMAAQPDKSRIRCDFPMGNGSSVNGTSWTCTRGWCLTKDRSWYLHHLLLFHWWTVWDISCQQRLMDRAPKERIEVPST